MPSRASRGLRLICIALQNLSNMVIHAKRLEAGTINRICAYAYAAYSGGTPGHEKNYFTMGSHHLTKMQKWVRYDAPRTHLEHYERE
ncbi:hypothetical protein TNCV_4472381 [Trichonephila clavipes]|uniref:Uncharacterized protein n=1 Tax=Trichonephila clavipes TaxID=2585209 RepID=A0A8X6SC73_TRICX|nr:hypothetical protein TNCV_4472381 [Trichonephila clavipes]